MALTTNLIDPRYGDDLHRAGFERVSARRNFRVTPDSVLQRIELRPNRHGGELTCDLTVHPLWARPHLNLQVLEPGIWIGALCSRGGIEAPTWYSRTDDGLAAMITAIEGVGLHWFDDTSTASGIVKSFEEYPEPWNNEDHVHVELGHAYL